MMKQDSYTNGRLKFTLYHTDTEGPAVILTHGFPDCAKNMFSFAEKLSEAGYRVYIPSMRGYEPSSQPVSKDYHVVRLAEDIHTLIQKKNLGKVHLVGHDWGAVAAIAAANLNPDSVYSITSMSIPHPKSAWEHLSLLPSQLLHSWYMFFFQIPAAPELLIPYNDFAFLEKLWRDWSPSLKQNSMYLANVKSVFRLPGVIPAALAYYRGLKDVASEAGRQSWSLLAQDMRVPALFLAGAEDGCMQPELIHGDPSIFRGGVAAEILMGCGHFLHLEKEEVVSQKIIRWLRSHTGGASSAT